VYYSQTIISLEIAACAVIIVAKVLSSKLGHASLPSLGFSSEINCPKTTPASMFLSLTKMNRPSSCVSSREPSSNGV